MSTIDPNISSTYDALGLTPRRGAPKEGDGLQDQFMTLMLTQMKYQDPLKPMENGEFLAQLAQFNTVSGIQELQKSFAAFAGSMQGNQALQASTLVGRQVLVEGDRVALAQQGGVEGVAQLPQSTQSLRLAIHDASGQLVQSIELGPQRSGEVPLYWNGMDGNGNRAAPGDYFISAAASIDGQMQALPTQVVATVESVTLGQGGREITMNVSGQGEVPMSLVSKVM